MKKFILILTVLFLSLIFVSCSGSSGGGSDPAPQEEEDTGGTTGGTTGGSTGGSSGGTSGGTSGGAARLTYDSELSKKEIRALDVSTQALADIEIDGRQIRRFSQIFGGNRSSNVVNYFETRVNYALSASTNLADRQVFSARLLAEGVVVASNPSTSLWYLTKVTEPVVMKFEINNKLLTISSTRIGIMQFGAFVDFPTIEQLNTLVHEARHSDCTGGALKSDIENYRNSQPIENNLCGHLHVKCPAGHPFAGEFACDDLPWGAYAIGAIYSGSIALECSSCTETQKVLAQAMTLDAISRLLYDFGELMDGRFGPPDMSSSNRVR